MGDKPESTAKRGAVRVDTSFTVEYVAIDGSGLKDISDEIRVHKTSDRLSLPASGGNLPSDLDSLKDFQDTPSNVMKMWVSIEQKLDTIIKLVGVEAHGLKDALKGVVKDISSKGVNLKTEEKLKLESSIMIRMSPPIFPSFTIDVVGKVLSVDSSGDGENYSKIEFTSIHPDDQELLITFVFKRQREILRTKHE